MRKIHSVEMRHQNAGLWSFLGWGSMRLGRQVLALTVLAGFLSPLEAQNTTAEIRAHYELAREAIAHHDLERASQEYAEILRLDPRDANIAAAQGALLYGLGRPGDAAKVLQTALALDPSQSNAEIFLGLSRSDLGRCADAAPLLQKHFNERTEIKLRRMVGLSLLNCYAGSSEFDQALELARSMKQLFPDDPDVLYNLAELYSQLLNGTIDELLKKHPDSFRIHELEAETLEAAGRKEQALKEYRKALEINPKTPRIHYRIGNLVVSEGDTPEVDREAISEFQKELEVNPGDAASEYQIAEILRRNRQFENAQTHCQRALELSPAFAQARVGLAQIYAAKHEPEKAVEEFEKAIHARPDNSAAHYGLMMAYRDLGRMEDAKRELAIFQKLDASKEKDFRSRLGSLLTGEPANTGRQR